MGLTKTDERRHLEHLETLSLTTLLYPCQNHREPFSRSQNRLPHGFFVAVQPHSRRRDRSSQVSADNSQQKPALTTNRDRFLNPSHDDSVLAYTVIALLRTRLYPLTFELVKIIIKNKLH